MNKARKNEVNIKNLDTEEREIAAENPNTSVGVLSFCEKDSGIIQQCNIKY